MEIAEQLLKLQQTLFPRSCSLCLEALNSKQQTLCSGCIDDLPYNNDCCLKCAEPLVSNGICPTCQKSPPNYRLCHTLCIYSHPISLAIKSMKKKPFAPETKQLSFLFAQQLQTIYRANDFPEIIIPMPLHPLKMLLRGFNQSLLIAQFLSAKLAYTEVKNNICIRKHFSQAQRLGTRIQRLKILPTTFNVYNQSEIQGRTLALVDDVVTTGSTASAATASLLNAGAKSVDLWCIAKTSWQN
jgi:ComF family protein